MIIKTKLNVKYKVINVPNDEINGRIGTCDGHYGMDKSFSIIRFNYPLSTGERSIVLINSCLEPVVETINS